MLKGTSISVRVRAQSFTPCGCRSNSDLRRYGVAMDSEIVQELQRGPRQPPTGCQEPPPGLRSVDVERTTRAVDSALETASSESRSRTLSIPIAAIGSQSSISLRLLMALSAVSLGTRAPAAGTRGAAPSRASNPPPRATFSPLPRPPGGCGPGSSWAPARGIAIPT